MYKPKHPQQAIFIPLTCTVLNLVESTVHRRSRIVTKVNLFLFEDKNHSFVT